MTRKAHRDKDALEIDRPEEFLSRERAAQKAGIVLLTLFALAGLAGVFGNGPLAATTITSGDTTIRFDRFARQTFRTELEVFVTGASAPVVTINLSRTFLDDVDMLDVQPPDALKRLDDKVVTFEVPSGDGAASLVLRYEPTRYGILEADVIAGRQAPVHIRQIVFF